jgi:type IV pilus assembly protein PilQ
MGDDIVLERSGPLKGDWPREKVRRVNIAFHKTSLHNAFRFFAEVSALNIVVADEVKGEVTLELRNVPWTEALSAVLQTKRLVAIREGNIVRVLRQKDWQKELRP